MRSDLSPWMNGGNPRLGKIVRRNVVARTLRYGRQDHAGGADPSQENAPCGLSDIFGQEQVQEYIACLAVGVYPADVSNKEAAVFTSKSVSVYWSGITAKLADLGLGQFRELVRVTRERHKGEVL